MVGRAATIIESTSRYGISLAVLFLLLAMASCAGKVPTAQCDNPRYTLDYYDSEVFDSELSRSLSCNPESVSVSLPASDTNAEIPQRLHTWIATVEASGGTLHRVVSSEESDQFHAKNFDRAVPVSHVYEMVESIGSNSVEKAGLYSSVKGYNVTIVYEGKRITRIEFESGQ